MSKFNRSYSLIVTELTKDNKVQFDVMHPLEISKIDRIAFTTTVVSSDYDRIYRFIMGKYRIPVENVTNIEK